MESESEIVVEVVREVCGHSSRLAAARILCGPPWVLRFIEGSSFAELCAALAVEGYPFRVQVVEREVSVLDWYGMRAD